MMKQITKPIAFALMAWSAAFSMPGQAQTTSAENYPSKPITILVGFPPGGASDVITRLIAGHMQTALGQTVIVKNQPGVNGNIASEEVARAQPDGYTLLLGSIANAINASLLKGIRHDTEKAFIPVAHFMSSPNVLVVNPKVPAKTVQELIALAKQKPGSLTYASSGAGSSPHLAAEMLKLRAGIDMPHIPYKGAAPALTDVIGGHVDLGFKTALSAIPSMENGSLRPLAIAADKRLPQMPDVPTMAEAGIPNFEVVSWNGLFAPAGTPDPIVQKLNKTVNDIIQTPEIKSRIELMAGYPGSGSSKAFTTYVHDEIAKWGKVVREGNIQSD